MPLRARTLLLLTLLLPATARAQAPATISGRVLDGTSANPVAFATVIVERPPSTDQVAATLAGEDGHFVVQGLPPATYRIRISFPGYYEATTDLLVSPLNAAYSLGDVPLRRLETFEETVNVTAAALRTEGVGSQVFRLDEGPTQATGTLLDALKTMPGVTVDQDGRVLLRGSDRVSVLIDGRQSSLTGFGDQRGLDSVSAANVEAIEIIYNPSARFDAAGLAGIVNIIYKEDQQRGLSGDVGFGIGLGQLGKQRDDLPTDLGSFSTNAKVVPSLNLNYRTERLRSFVQTEVLFQDDLPNNEFTTRFYDDGRVIESQVPENREQYHYTIRAGVDWFVSGTDTLTVSGVQDFESHTDRAEVPFILQSSGERQRFWFWREEEDTGFANIAMNLEHRFDTPGHELSVNLQYTRGREDEAYFLNEESPVRTGTDMTHLIATEHTLPVAVDYSRPLRTGRLELGGKLQWRWIPVSYAVNRGEQSVIYEGLGDSSNWDEDLFAAYANFVRVMPAYTLEAGLRVEHTRVSYRIPVENVYYEASDRYGYFEAFPNAKVTYNLDDANQLMAAYNRRVDRPGEPELRLFPKYDDPELLKVGNPYLRPQFTHAFEVGYVRSWAGGSASTALFRRLVDDAFLRVFAIDDSNPNYDIVNRVYENAGNSTTTGIQVLLTQDVNDDWRLSGNLTWFRRTIDPLDTVLLFPTRRLFSLPGSTDDAWDVTVNNRIQLPRAVEVQAGLVYYSARNVPQGVERARSSVDVSATWPFADERAEVVLTLTDIFNDFGVEQDLAGNGFTALYQNLLETQVASLGLRFRF